jgi:hypothetical protein
LCSCPRLSCIIAISSFLSQISNNDTLTQMLDLIWLLHLWLPILSVTSDNETLMVTSWISRSIVQSLVDAYRDRACIRVAVCSWVSTCIVNVCVCSVFKKKPQHHQHLLLRLLRTGRPPLTPLFLPIVVIVRQRRLWYDGWCQFSYALSDAIQDYVEQVPH